MVETKPAHRRISLNLSPSLKDDAALLEAYRALPPSRRQEWLRRNLISPATLKSGSRIPGIYDPDEESGESETQDGESIRIEIRLRMDMPDEADFLRRYEMIPGSRRSEWVRNRLIVAALRTVGAGEAGGATGGQAAEPVTSGPARPSAKSLAGLMGGEG